MPSSFQIKPSGSIFRPKIETFINDNTFVDTTATFGGGNNTSVMCVFTSPKGRDNKVISIENGLTEFLDEYGTGSFSLYGQPLLNAYASASVAASAGATLHCMRVMPDDAAYSTATLIAKYRVDTTAGTMEVAYVVKPSDAEVLSLADLDTVCDVEPVPDAEGFTPLKIATIAYQGRGVYGKNIRFRIANDSASDKLNSFKNYFFTVYRNESFLQEAETFGFSIDPSAILANTSLYLEDVIDDLENGSKIITMATFTDSLTTLYEQYLTAQPTSTLTMSDFDPLLGIDKYTKRGITGLTILPASGITPGVGETAVDLSGSEGIALTGGSDGSIAEGAANRTVVLNQLYKEAFAGDIDRTIKSKNRFPTTFILDANFDVDTKLTIASLAIQRGDCMAMLDCGTEIRTLDSLPAYFESNFEGVVDNRAITIEGYAMDVRDPYSSKSVNVTGTYWLASEYLTHIANWNGKQRPLAGNTFGPITGYITNSVYPVFDDDLDGDRMDVLADYHVNYAAYNQVQTVVRKTQNTSQKDLSAATEQNNVLVILDIKRDCEALCARLEYDFSEVEDIARFNASLTTITDKYAAAQVKSITAKFDRNAWEAERSIIHLYVEMVMKGLIKNVIIELDINPTS